MRRFAWLLIVVGILGAIAVPVQAELALRAFVNSSDFPAWAMLSSADRASGVWRPEALRTAVFWDSWRWPAVWLGVGAAAFGVLLLAIRRPERGGP